MNEKALSKILSLSFIFQKLGITCERWTATSWVEALALFLRCCGTQTVKIKCTWLTILLNVVLLLM
jgi:hypothetical protein